MAMQVVAVGSGAMKPETQREIITGWQRTAKMSTASRRTTPRQMMDFARQLGVVVRSDK